MKVSTMIRRSVFIALMLAAAAAGAQDGQQAAASAQAEPAAPKIQVIDHKVGTGKEASAGSTVEVNYTGWLFKPLGRLQHGHQFDSSAGREPLEFRVGAGMVIKGWDQGVAGMKVGGKRTLIIPSELAYGKRGASGMIPPDADLIFDVELVDVK